VIGDEAGAVEAGEGRVDGADDEMIKKTVTASKKTVTASVLTGAVRL
jgi:hypothetical protein